MKEYRAYANFHRHPINVRIHYVGVPVLHATAMILLATHVHIFAPVACAILYCAYNVMLDAEAALVCLPYQLGVTAASTLIVRQALPDGVLTKGALTLHVASWIAQIIGHNVYEGNSPAILDSLVGSILTAPLFVVLEMLWSTGYALRIKSKLHQTSPS